MRGLNRSPQFLMFVSDLEKTSRAGGAVIRTGVSRRSGVRRSGNFAIFTAIRRASSRASATWLPLIADPAHLRNRYRHPVNAEADDARHDCTSRATVVSRPRTLSRICRLAVSLSLFMVAVRP